MKATGHIRAAALGVVAVALSLAGCSGGSGGGGGDDQPDRTPGQALEAARQTLDKTSGVHVELTTKDLPSSVTGITSADGVGVHPSAFQGTFSLQVSGFAADADVIAVDDTTYAKNSLLLPDWTQIDPADYGAPDPTKLMEPDNGFSGLLSATTGLERGKSVRGGAGNKEILTSYTGTVPGEAVSAIIPSASGDFSVTYTLTDDDELREAVLRGIFYEGADPVTYDLTLDDYGTSKDIKAPTS